MPLAQPDPRNKPWKSRARWLASGAVDLMVVDSAAALVPQLELESGIGESGDGLHSRVLASGLRRLRTAFKASGTVVLFSIRRARAASPAKERPAPAVRR